MGPGQALTIPARRRYDRRASWASAAAPFVAAILILNAGPEGPALSSLVAGVGLAVLAVTDATSHRLPATQVRVLAGLTATSLIGAAWWNDEWGPLLRALVGAAVLAFLLASLWLALPGAIAFGDVKVTVVAFAAAAAVSWRAGAVMVVLACVIGGCVAEDMLLAVEREAVTVVETPVPDLVRGRVPLERDGALRCDEDAADAFRDEGAKEVVHWQEREP